MKPTFVSCVFFSPYHLFTDWITVAPVKKQIALAQGQDHSPGALPTSPEFTLNAELTISLLHSLKLPPAMMEGCQALSSYTMFTLSLPPILLSFFHLCGLHLAQFKGFTFYCLSLALPSATLLRPVSTPASAFHQLLHSSALLHEALLPILLWGLLRDSWLLLHQLFWS